MLDFVPADGTPIGNGKLRQLLTVKRGREVSEAAYFAAQQELVDRGLLGKGKGRGGSVFRTVDAAPSLTLAVQELPAEADAPKPKQAAMTLAQAQRAKAEIRPRKGKAEEKVSAYQHKDKRTNNPEVGLVTPDDDTDERQTRYRHDPHIDPTLQWAGKAERMSFEVDTVSLHVHERIDPLTVLSALKKRAKGKVAEAQQDDWLQAWFDRPLPLREAIEFYKHDRGWANRLVAGDSLLVMNSLLQKESLAGQVQMIYIDPPYGIKYGSNFQPFVNKRDVKDRKDEDLTQEPEMIKAFRDTWELGIHSYLTYLRDRLLLAKELLHESGSVFVQISDQNLHHVRELMDELLGAENFVSQIVFKTKKMALGQTHLGTVCDNICWYTKNLKALKYRQLYKERAGLESEDGTPYQIIETPQGRLRRLTAAEKDDPEHALKLGRLFRTLDLHSSGRTESCVFDFEFHGRNCEPQRGRSWKTNTSGMTRLDKAGRLLRFGESPEYKLFFDDYPVQSLMSLWDDTQGASDKQYVVQTAQKVIERCLLMTTDPGDLVLDPTCGSGTTAFVAEKWGRRWITCDTSRVAVTLAKQRLMTASYDYYDLKYPHEGLKSGFIYKTVPHVTLKSIANNPEIDEIFGKLHPAIEQTLAKLNAALRAAPSPGPAGHPLPQGERGKAFTAAALQALPQGERGKAAADRASSPSPLVGEGLGRGGFVVTEGGRKGEALNLAKSALHEWEVPFDFPDDWPKSARAAFDAFHAARQAMQKKMDDSIAAHADQETLYDQPQVNRDKLRITGPFTVEAVPFPSVLAMNESEQIREPADVSIARSGESARQHGWRDELLKTGIRGKGGQMLKFASLETLPADQSIRYLHCTGNLADTNERVVVSFGPEHAALEQRQVEMAMREAGELFPRPKMIVFCAFAFDPEAAKDIDNTKGIVALKAQMNTDLLTEDLKKARASNQSFWLMGQPDVQVKKLADGRYQVEVNGFDYFDTKTGELKSGGKKNIAAWALDTDYDERSLFPRQVFFPMAGAKDGWNKLKRDIKAELDEGLMAKFHGTLSLPFEAGENRKIAVKIVDDRGIESLKVIPLD
ncbi:MAG: site-specific DNA-methyltransferase [Proteobacteria bacterium]|nr:site-specific DNA-methyltransferase [Pseudomonadota bacterium]